MLTHVISTTSVFQTGEYKNFSMIIGNRGINMNKVNKIIKEIENGNDMLEYYPIQVKVKNDKMEILDGQHRFFICRKLKRPVFYILVKEEKDMTDIARVNSNVEKWKNQDFINCYIQRKNNHYIRLQEFIELYGFNVGTCLRLLTYGQPGTEGSDEALKGTFEKGNFKVLKWDEAVSVAENCKLFSTFQYWKDRAFIIAIHRIEAAAKISIEQVHAAYKKSPDLLTKQYTHKDYTFNLEKIVNNGKHKRIVII